MSTQANSLTVAAGSGFAQLSIFRQIGLLVGLAASVALGVYVVLWSQKPEFVPLYGQMDVKNASEVVESLKRTGIPFQLDHKSGQVLVNAPQLHEARIALAKNGISGNIGTGFELLDKSSGIGTSQFIERTRFIRGLQGELERTISHIELVNSARVHLAVPKPSAFLRHNRKPSASVFLELQGGFGLDRTQVAAIANLVASSIQGLTTKNVTIIDQNGRLLSSKSEDGMGLVAQKLEFTRQIEEAYAQRIIELLTPIIGDGQVKAKVTAKMDFTERQETFENFNPENKVVRSERTLAIAKNSSEALGGIPGALSNEPPANTAIPDTVADVGEAEGENTNQKPLLNQQQQATRNYEIDRKIGSVKKFPGIIKRLTVAVVVGNKIKFSKKGRASYTPLTKEEKDELISLAKDAIGFDQQRGDSIKLLNMALAKPAPIPEIQEKSLLEQPWFFSVAKQVAAGLLILILLFVILKPTMKKLAVPVVTHDPNERKKLESSENESDNEEGEEATKKALSPEQTQLDLAKIEELIQSDPKRVAQVVKNWVGDEDE